MGLDKFGLRLELDNYKLGLRLELDTLGLAFGLGYCALNEEGVEEGVACE